MTMKDSIAFRFNLVALIVVTLVLAGFGFYNYQASSDRFYRQLEHQSDLLLDRLELSLPNTLWNFEMEQLRKILESEAQADWVQGIYVSDGKKDVASLKRNENGELVSGERPLGVQIEKQRKLQYEDGGNLTKVGEVTVYVDTTEIEAALSESVFRLVLQTIILDIAIMLLLFRLVQKIVVKPLKEVVGALQDIAHGEGDLTQRLKERPGEMGELATNFNLFVGNIQSLIRQVMANIESISASVNSMAQIANRTNQGVERQQQ